MRALALAALLLLALFTSTAGASIGADRVANVESGNALDQISASSCTGNTAAADTAQAYNGTQSLKVHYNDTSSCTDYARGIFEQNGANHLVQNDDFWIGAAIYLPTGFYANHAGYTDLLRIDNYVQDAGASTAAADRANIALASYSDDSLHVVASDGQSSGGFVTSDLLGSIPSSALPAGQWNWVEMRIKLSPTAGSAITQLKINGVSQGSTTARNQYSGGTSNWYNRVRYGLVSASDGVPYSGDLTAWVDRMSIRSTELGPLTGANGSYSSDVLGTSGLVSYWRLGEASGTTAADSKGSNPGSYVNSPTLQATSLVPNEPSNKAAGFDGVDDHVSIAPSASLNMTGGVTLEAWAKPDVLQGTILRRDNSYELRVETDGSVLFRVWVGSNVQTLTSSAGAVSAGSTVYLAGTYDGSNMRIYRNGVQIASRAQTGAMTHSSNTLYIGRNTFSNTYFDGVVDEAAIYNTALSATTLNTRYCLGVNGCD